MEVLLKLETLLLTMEETVNSLPLQEQQHITLAVVEVVETQAVNLHIT